MTKPKTLETCVKDTKNTLFLGIPIRQYHADLWLWEKFINAYPIKTFIELGTGSGGMTLFFQLHAIQNCWDFYTFDIAEPEAQYSNVWTRLEMFTEFTKGDIFNDVKPKLVKLIKQSENPIMLYCDNGNKPLEVKEFGSLLEVGDFVAVHDWGTEFLRKDIPDTFEEIFTKESDVIASKTRWMRKKI